MAKQDKTKELSIMQIGDKLEDAKKIDPKAPVKLIIQISPYDRKIIELIQEEGLELEFEMPLRKSICGTIRIDKYSFIRKLALEGKITNVEVLGISSVEMM